MTLFKPSELKNIYQKGDTWRIKGVAYARFDSFDAAHQYYEREILQIPEDNNWKSVEETLTTNESTKQEDFLSSPSSPTSNSLE